MLKDKTLFCLIAVVCLFICHTLTGQNNAIDSLKNIIKTTKDDLVRFKAINQLADAIVVNNPDSALLLIEQILPAIQSIDNPPLLIDAMYTKGRVYEERQQLDSSLIIYEETKEITQRENDLVNLTHFLDLLL